MIPATKPVRYGFICLLCTGLSLFLFGLVFGLVVRSRVDHTLKTASRICGEDDSQFDNWRTNTDSDDAPKYKMFYGFNVTNAQDFLQQTPANPQKLKLDVHGPYAMRQWDTLYNVRFFDDNRQVTYKTWTRYEYEQQTSCPTCSNTEYYTNVNPGLLSLMTRASSELAIGLTLSNADLSYGTLPRCNSTNMVASLSTVCAPTAGTTCCCNSTSDPTNPMSCMIRASGLYSKFAEFDGGISFQSPIYGQTTSPLLIRKNVHEFAYGYPSAMLGLAFANLQPSSIPLLAQFTELVMAACSYNSTGIAPSQEALEGKPWQFLNLITCKPIEGSRYWAETIQTPAGNLQRCALVGTDACKCSVNTNRTTTTAMPCCTVAGLGCLYKVTGYVSDDQYLSQAQSEMSYTIDNTTQNTGCGKFDNDEHFWWSRYENKTQTDWWAQQNRAHYTPPSQLEVLAATSDNSQFTYRAPVYGDDGTRTKPTGVTSSLMSPYFSDGSSHDTRVVYITQAYRGIEIYKTGTESWNGIKVARYSPAPYFLSRGVKAFPGTMENYEVGAATPTNGLQDGTYHYGFPTYISRPLYLFGNESLLTDGIEVTVDGSSDYSVAAENYDTYLLVEPASGMTINGHKRLQASFGIYKCESALQACNPATQSSLANLLSPWIAGGKVIPQYWMDETSSATSKQLNQLKDAQALNHSAGVFVVVGPVLGGLLAIFAGVMLFRLKSRRTSAIDASSLLTDRD